MNQFLKKLSVLIIFTCFIYTNTFALTKNESIIPPELQKKLEEVYGKIKSDYVDSIDDKKLMEGAINGLVTNLDPHSSYLDIDAQKDFTAATSGEFSGVGIDTGMEDGLVRVVSPIEDSPAYKAGLKTGDLVFEIDGKAKASIPGKVWIDPQYEFYDFQAKYLDGATRIDIPAPFDAEIIEKIQKLALIAFNAIGAKGLARVDFFVTHSGEIIINEINTMPGFTRTSAYPKMWQATGIGYSEVITHLLQSALAR